MVVWYNIFMKCMLTFDDGPNGSHTASLLDILKRYELQAIFFVIGEHAEEYPDLVRRIHDEGHEIGNHT